MTFPVRPSASFSITDQMPEVNFLRHCWTPASPAHPNLYKCPKIEEGIKACQAAGKKVLTSLGGATGNNNLHDAQASVLARTLWDLFLEGSWRNRQAKYQTIWKVIEILYLLLTLFSLGGGAHIVPALTFTNDIFETARRIITKSRDFPKIYQRKVSHVNDVSMMIEVSIATVSSKVYFDYFLSFLSLFSVFYPSFVRRR